MLRILLAIAAALVFALGASAALSSRTTHAAARAASGGSSASGGRVFVYASIRAAGARAPVDFDVVSDLFTVRLDGTGAQRLTRTSAWESEPAWSPNRRLIAYTRGDPHCHASTCEWGPTQTDIWVMAANGAHPRPLTDRDDLDEYLDGSPTWSPDSRQVAFARNDNVDGSDPENGIYVVGADGKGFASRLSRAEAVSLAWSPKGSTIAYVHLSYRYVALFDVATGRARRLRATGFSSPSSVAWSPRGRFLAITSGRKLFIVRASGGVARKVAEARGIVDVSWSPDGCCLLFSAIPGGARYGRTAVYVVSVRGGRPRRLKKRGLSDFAPAWRP
jgi:Tol biopolymer transport system component